MISHQVELLNVEELVEIPGRPGLLLQRIPEAVRQRLREQSQVMYRKAACCEIRFVSDWEPVAVTLASYEGNSVISVFYGDYFVSQRLITEEATDFLLELPSPTFCRKKR
ncbi:hypothetical protein N6H14_26535 [Paenibacillus sp. CC-CFT747]|nr:hypothetical protein N6H14_26535 [Paenibacillus sp. CC-CFT747]